MTILLNSCSNTEFKEYESVNKFYTIKYPEDWIISSESDSSNIINVYPKGSEASITISAYFSKYDDITVSSLEDKINSVFNDFERIKGFDYENDGQTQKVLAEYYDNEINGKTKWLTLCLTSGNIFVFATSNYNESLDKKFYLLSWEIMNSLKINIAKNKEINTANR